jgi:hypothetical protein
VPPSKNRKRKVPKPAPLPPPNSASKPQWQTPAAILGALCVLAATLLALGFVKSWIFPIVTSIALIFLVLVLLSVLTAFKQFRDTYGDLYKLLVSLSSAAMLAILGAVYFTGLTERSQTKQLLTSALRDADATLRRVESSVFFVKDNGITSLSEWFARTKVPLPERTIKISSDLLVVRNVSPETLSAISNDVANIKTVVDGINQGHGSDAALKQSVVMYIDLLVLVHVHVLNELKRLDGDISNEQMLEVLQAINFDTATFINDAFVEAAFQNIAKRRFEAVTTAFKSITGRDP